MCISARDSVLPVVPMFHVNAWGIPYSAALTGCKLVFPGPALDLSLIHISEPTRLGMNSYAVFCLKKKTYAVFCLKKKKKKKKRIAYIFLLFVSFFFFNDTATTEIYT